jgi:uncharacterized protein (TIGR02118 family)
VGSRGSVLKVYILSRRRPDLSHQEFLKHWRDVHAPLFAEQPDTRRYVRRYIQSWLTEDAPDGFTLGDTDGIVQLWFDDLDGFNDFYNSPSYVNVIRPDEERFTDPQRCEFFFVEEHPVIW